MCEGYGLIASFEAGTGSRPEVPDPVQPSLSRTDDGIWVILAHKVAHRIEGKDLFVPATGGDPYPLDAIAQCRRGATHPAPDPNCTCGFHAVSESAPEPYGGRFTVLSVALSGRILAAHWTHGGILFRAERQTVLTFTDTTVPDPIRVPDYPPQPPPHPPNPAAAPPASAPPPPRPRQRGPTPAGHPTPIRPPRRRRRLLRIHPRPHHFGPHRRGPAQPNPGIPGWSPPPLPAAIPLARPDRRAAQIWVICPELSSGMCHSMTTPVDVGGVGVFCDRSRDCGCEIRMDDGAHVADLGRPADNRVPNSVRCRGGRGRRRRGRRSSLRRCGW
ncbi:hypothetical protein NSERKGN1266_32620 [Nocardia seriolae]|nr:hypothetical protein NSERKGN1266_32620 [Nocardia seriolae]